ncbi:hypothetical protein [Mucilaginibacter dorajii]|nr:hypothetical protein [Mucilaginibacter dorajii]MCS3737910.1 hypothetical protein [Mucilaginibacter dorajii]
MKYSLIMLLLFTCYYASAQNKLPKADQLPDQVGDIIFNTQTDQYDFKLCNKENIYQYYSVNTTYTGEIKALKKELYDGFKYDAKYAVITGSVTIRFIVNCKAQTDWFRVNVLNSNYQRTAFPSEFINKLLLDVKNLKGWIPGKLPNGAVCDSYYFLHFRILRGRINNIAI